MLINCPRCGNALPTADVNVSTDVAACRRCDDVFKLSELVRQAEAQVRLAAPPPGAWLEERADGFRAGASTRSPIAFFLVPFMLVWSGGSVGGIYGTQIMHGHFDLGASLFGIPFLLGSVIFWSFALMAIAGKCELTVRGDDAELFIGIRSLGWRRRFRWSEVLSVTESVTTVRYRGSQGASLCLEGRTRLKFGSGLNEARRYFLLQALRRNLKRAPAVEPAPYRS